MSLNTATYEAGNVIRRVVRQLGHRPPTYAQTF